VDAGFVDSNGNANANIEDMDDVSAMLPGSPLISCHACVVRCVAVSLAVNFPQFLLSDDVKGRIASWVVKLAAQKPADRPSW
jgi:hypothetical protein